MVTAASEYGSTAHEFVDLDSAVDKIHELIILGIPHLTITRHTDSVPGD